VQSGYGELLPKGKSPFAIIFVQIDPGLVDVNVHPTKSEVRFADERGVHDLVYARIKESLTSPQIIPDLKAAEQQAQSSHPYVSKETTTTQHKPDWTPRTTQPTRSSSFSSISKKEEELAQKSFFSEAGEKLRKELTEDGAKIEKETSGVSKVEPGATNLWQLADTYILSQVKGNLMVLDQHAAHERILYEEALRNLTERQATSQQVLFPTVSELSPQEFQILEEHKKSIQKLGFEIKHFGGRTILVTAVPALIRNKSGEVFLREILTQLEEEEKVEKDRLKAVAKSFACHGAIKAGERLTQEEMHNLMRQLFSTHEPYSCPHGRPTVIKLSLEELNKKFGRS
jgi:DNA mismatch repair protein MutL